MSLILEQDFGTKGHKFNVKLLSNPTARVELVDGTRQPLETVTKLTRGYSGEYSNLTPLEEEIDKAINDLNNTKLKTPFEMAYFVFLIKDVTRSFTHQLVRTRQASYVQESMRFLGHKKEYKCLISGNPDDGAIIVKFFNSVCESICNYEDLMKMGMSSEEARGVLPHSILTSVFVGAPLSSFQKMYEQRMCCQAQPGEWQVVMRGIKRALGDVYGRSLS